MSLNCGRPITFILLANGQHYGINSFNFSMFSGNSPLESTVYQHQAII